MAKGITQEYDAILEAARKLSPVDQLRLAKALMSGDHLATFWEGVRRASLSSSPQTILSRGARHAAGSAVRFCHGAHCAVGTAPRPGYGGRDDCLTAPGIIAVLWSPAFDVGP